MNRKLYLIISFFLILFFGINNEISGQFINLSENYFSIGYGIIHLEDAYPEAIDRIKFNQNVKRNTTGIIYGKFEFLRNLSNISTSANINYYRSTLKTDSIMNGVSNSIFFSQTGFSIKVRCDYNFGDFDNHQPYIGFGMGIRAIRWKIISNIKFESKKSESLGFPIGVELTYGSRYFITDRLAIYGEIGFAASILQFGLTVAL